jgi:hypothetical protein
MHSHIGYLLLKVDRCINSSYKIQIFSQTLLLEASPCKKVHEKNHFDLSHLDYYNDLQSVFKKVHETPFQPMAGQRGI